MRKSQKKYHERYKQDKPGDRFFIFYSIIAILLVMIAGIYGVVRLIEWMKV